jgi:hypothetical protein
LAVADIKYARIAPSGSLSYLDDCQNLCEVRSALGAQVHAALRQHHEGARRVQGEHEELFVGLEALCRLGPRGTVPAGTRAGRGKSA